MVPALLPLRLFILRVAVPPRTLANTGFKRTTVPHPTTCRKSTGRFLKPNVSRQLQKYEGARNSAYAVLFVYFLIVGYPMGDDTTKSTSLPVIRSLVSPQALADLIKRSYGLSDVGCQLVKGTIRDVYQIESNAGPRIFALYRHNRRTRDQIKAELLVLDHLHQNAIQVPTAVPTLDGDAVVTLELPEGTRIGVIFTYLEGEQLSRSPDSKTVRRFGHLVAEIHCLLDALPRKLARPVLGFESIVTDSIQAFESAFGHKQEEISYLKSVALELAPRMSELSTDTPQFGLVHGDISASNTRLLPGGKLGILDFDFSGWGWRAYDVATYASEVRYWRAPDENRTAFLKGYQEVRPLTDSELRSIPVFEAARHIHSLGTPSMYVDEWGSAYLSQNLLKSLLSCTADTISGIS